MSGGFPSPPLRVGARHQSFHPDSSTPVYVRLAHRSLPLPNQPYRYHVHSTAPGDPNDPLPKWLPPSDIHVLTNPRSIPVLVQRPQDSNAAYRPPPSPQPSTASESVDVEPLPGSQRTSHPTPSSVNQDHRNGSASSGYKPTIGPPNPNDQAYHPAPPPGLSYGQPVPYGAPSPYLGQYSGQQAQVRRKQVRATQACNHCRARKQKCDEARPCQFCRENNFDCQYKDVPPPK
jgi:hypothetical protein